MIINTIHNLYLYFQRLFKDKMNKTPIHHILRDDDDVQSRLDRLEKLLTRQAAASPTIYQPTNVVKGQSDCMMCATRTSMTEKIMYFSLGVVLTTIITLLVRNMKNNQRRR
jgi:hypothetical protein